MKKILLSILLTLALTGCGAGLTTTVKNVRLGMTKEQVITTLGKNFEAEGAAQTPEGTLETISFHEVHISYLFHFLDNRLVEWGKKQPAPLPPTTNVNITKSDN